MIEVGLKAVLIPKFLAAPFLIQARPTVSLVMNKDSSILTITKSEDKTSMNFFANFYRKILTAGELERTVLIVAFL